MYLAGPINGLSLKEANDWRDDLGTAIYQWTGAYPLSPLRDKEGLEELSEIGPQGYETTLLSNQRALVTRDRYDVQRCDLMVVNLLGAKQVSIGTMVELGWADARRIPIIVIMEEGNIHDHAFIREIANWIVPAVADALTVVKSIL